MSTISADPTEVLVYCREALSAVGSDLYADDHAILLGADSVVIWKRRGPGTMIDTDDLARHPSFGHSLHAFGHFLVAHVNDALAV